LLSQNFTISGVEHTSPGIMDAIMFDVSIPCCLLNWQSLMSVLRKMTSKRSPKTKLCLSY